MVKLIHARTGGTMWVAESRLAEYLGAGHRLASSPTVEATEEPKPAAKKRTRKKKEG